MTAAVTQIIQQVEQLSRAEQVQLRRCLLEQIPMSDDLTDDDFASLAAESFHRLDDEEGSRAS